jgi:hypothetical protein
LFHRRTNIAAFPRPFPKKGAVYRVVFGKKRPNTSVRLSLLKSLLRPKKNTQNSAHSSPVLFLIPSWRANGLCACLTLGEGHLTLGEGHNRNSSAGRRACEPTKTV